MRQMTRMAICVLTLGMLTPGIAAADPIPITAGSLTGNFTVSIQLSSFDGSFTLSGSGDRVGGLFGPSLCFPCAPGSLQTLESRWVGGDFHGQATIDGTTYLFPGGEFGAQASVEFLGSWIAPAFLGETFTSVTNPFTFTGVFFYPFEGTLPVPREDLFGQGLATVNLQWLPSISAWQFAGAVYTFSADPAADPIPEPSTMLLAGAGLVLLSRRLRRSTT